jgi:two-component system, NtrC family, sensor histidine kinase KinB
MKTTIRSKRFIMGMVLFLVIILLLSISSVFYLNRLSVKTSAILKENHYSVAYAKGMSENLTNINLEITNCILTNKYPDSILINKEIVLFDKSLQLENNNITEIGENKLASDIETGFSEYCDSVEKFIQSPKPVEKVISLQKKFNSLYQQLMLLSQINEKAIEEKTNDAKVSAKNASIQMSFIATLCFLIAYGFSFSFASYYNERFFKLYDGIKEMASSKYRQRLSFKGTDEFSEISLIINEMAEKLSENNEKRTLTLQLDSDTNVYSNDIEELKSVLNRIKSIEEHAVQLISKFENKK